MKKRIFVIQAVLMLLLAAPTFSQTLAGSDPIAERATWWAKMFSGLKASYSVTVVVVSFEHVYEIEKVTALEAHGEFLILRQKGKDNRDYRVVVHASNVMLIREGEG